MKQARLAAGWLKQKSKLLPVLLLAILVSTLVLSVVAPQIEAAAAPATWSDNYKTLTYDGTKYTGGSGDKATFTSPKVSNAQGCQTRITFSGDYKTATSATFQSQTVGLSKAGSYCTGYASNNNKKIAVDSASGTSSANTTTAASSGGDSSKDIDPCNATRDPLSWIICPIVDLINKGTQTMQNGIDSLMSIDSKGIFDTSTASGKAYFSAWNSFRIFGIAFLIIAGLVMVISQSLGFEVFDAYTVRKVVPRLITAAIGISVSWYLLRFFVDITNDIGIGIRSIIYYPFQSLAPDAGIQSVPSALLADLAVGGAFLFLGLGGVLSLVLTAGLAALVAFLVLVIRQIVIVFLILMAPIAIACYVLPNTQKVYSLWWDSLSKALMMFPIISAFIAAGQVFSVVASSDTSDSFSINKLIAIVAFFLPYFALPFTFRLAGGALATIGGLANDRSRGAFDRLKQYRGQKTAQNTQDMKTGNRFRSSNAAARAFNKTTSTLAAVPSAGSNPLRMRSRMQAAMSSHSMEEAAEFSEKNAAMRTIIGNDDFLTAGIRGKGSDSRVRSELTAMGYKGPALEQGVAAIRAAHRGASDEVFDTAAAMALPATGTAFRGGAGEMHDMINEVAGNDRVKAGRMLASMRSGASGARRFDIAGGGFGDQIGVLEKQFDKGMTTQQANDHIVKASLEGQGGSYIAGARPGAVKNFAPAMMDQLNKAVASGDSMTIDRELAKFAGRYDAMAQVSPENAEVLAREVMGQTLIAAGGRPEFKKQDGSTLTVREMIEDRRNTSSNFLDMRREYGAAAARGGQAAQQQEQLAQQMRGPQGPIAPPQAGPNGPVMGG